MCKNYNIMTENSDVKGGRKMSNVIEKLRSMDVPNSKENMKIDWPLTQADVTEKLRAEEFITRFKAMNRDPEKYFSYRCANGRRIATTDISMEADASTANAFSDYAIAYIENGISAVILKDNPKIGKNACVSVIWSHNPLETYESIKVKIAIAG